KSLPAWGRPRPSRRAARAALLRMRAGKDSDEERLSPRRPRPGSSAQGVKMNQTTTVPWTAGVPAPPVQFPVTENGKVDPAPVIIGTVALSAAPAKVMPNPEKMVVVRLTF